MLSEIRSTCLHERCTCGGKLYRHIVRGFANHGDDGNQLLITLVYDRCNSCKDIDQKTNKAHHYIIDDLNRLFTLWESGALVRPTFDEQINRLFGHPHSGPGLVKTAHSG